MNSLNLKELRQKLGLTQKSLAQKVGVSVTTIQNWESGGVIPKTKEPILEALLTPNIVSPKIYGGQHVLGGDAVNGDKIVEKITEREIEIDKAEFECDPLVATLRSTIADQKDRITFLENQLAESQSQLADANKRIQTLTDKLLNI